MKYYQIYKKNKYNFPLIFFTTLCLWLCLILPAKSFSGDLDEIMKNKVIRHLGVPYANFITGSGDGMDVELIQGFAEHLGVRYQYVETSWGDVTGDLTGKKVKATGDDITIIGEVPVKGDLIANGFTVLEWRKKIVNYSNPTFPTQVWMIATADSSLQPVIPGKTIEQDIDSVKSRLSGLTVLGLANTCLDPKLYDIKGTGATVKLFHAKLNEMAPAVINREADATLLDVPDALIALDKWPGKVKVIGPVSGKQEMAVAFPKDAPELLKAFNAYLSEVKSNGIYVNLVKKYYPAVFDYYPEFFE
ncbi:ABC transporter, periplasmic substrate-binding protein [Desulfamplus magnetovallimortis]|uniref:ABC transporter, periplasmic substrate-binding protein n=1 Tax=Desulfamplus magnetovallimortis TaxID=1246637 RepID=A0A1W1HJ26_9BACT|nr:transporter substrate-binding domain-containing protein [Desulfamplus magnetovallimortis]SLM32517.1 ABC transporter, periplasmic substrate-binding protein [Desulfamplus magnetovallimortis]